MIVLDTHVVVWCALQPKKLSARAQRALDEANAAEGFIFCEISLWEIAMLLSHGRLSIDTCYQEFIRLITTANRCTFHGITPEIAELSTTLADEVGADPADRLIAATAIAAGASLVTADRQLRRASAVTTIW